MEKNISIQQKIKQFIEEKPAGEIFRYKDLPFQGKELTAVSKSLSRFSKKGIVRRLRKGMYYKPKQTIFGELGPGENEIINAFTVNEKSIIGYRTGLSEFNRLGLTTQVPNEIIIKVQGNKRNTKIGNLRIKYSGFKQNIRESDIDKLQILDAIKNLKKIPDTGINNSIVLITSLIEAYSLKDKYRLLLLSKKYNAQTRALLGAIFELKGLTELSKILQNTLNPLTKYRIAIDKNVLPTKSNWNIV